MINKEFKNESKPQNTTESPLKNTTETKILEYNEIEYSGSGDETTIPITVTTTVTHETSE